MEINFDNYKELVSSLRRELHKIPELGGEEVKTSEFIKSKLKEWGIKNIKSLFGTGVSVVIGDEKLPCIAIRGDMDGLPVKEETGLSFSSTHEGKMHACGHDGHTAVLLTLAKIFSDNEYSLNKCVKLIFQPAEETDGGADGMIKEGVLENPYVEKVFGFHLWPGILVGKAEYSFGASFAEAERYEISVKGNGGHGAMPEGVQNCLYACAEIIQGIKKIDENHKDSVLSVCSINSSGHHNVFADFALIKGTIRTVIDGEREKIEKEIIELCNECSCEATPEFTYEYPVARNCDTELKELVEASKKALGDENVSQGTYTYAAEDFAFFTRERGGAHIKVGIVNPENPDTMYPLHNPKFNIDENALINAVKIFVNLVV